MSVGATFSIGRKDKPVSIHNRSEYNAQLMWLEKKFVVLYDVGDRRGWLVDGLSTLLHLVRASLQNDLDGNF